MCALHAWLTFYTMRCSQVEFMGEQQRKIQGDLEMREQQVQELQRARNEMYEKLMEAENSKGRHDEARLHKELAQLQVRVIIRQCSHDGFNGILLTQIERNRWIMGREEWTNTKYQSMISGIHT